MSVLVVRPFWVILPIVCIKMTDEKRKPDLVLSNGREVFFDFEAITYKEMTGIFDKDGTKEESDEVIRKICGFVSLSDFQEISAKDARKCARKVVHAWLNWQDDPND
jgi:hypothetical protein